MHACIPLRGFLTSSLNTPQISFALQFGGGLTAASLAQSNTVLLTRLGIACYVEAPLETVAVVSITPVTASIRASPVLPAAGSNSAPGTCDQLRARRLTGSVLYSGRALPGSDSATYVEVAMAITLPNATQPQQTFVQLVVQKLQGLLSNSAAAQSSAAMLGNSSATGSVNASTGGTALGTLLSGAVKAGATSSGINPSQASVGGSAASVGVTSAGGASSNSGVGSAIAGLAAGAVAAIVVVLLLVGAAAMAFVFFYRKNAAKPLTSSEPAIENPGISIFPNTSETSMPRSGVVPETINPYISRA